MGEIALWWENKKGQKFVGCTTKWGEIIIRFLITKVIFVIYMKSHSFYNIRNYFNYWICFLKRCFQFRKYHRAVYDMDFWGLVKKMLCSASIFLNTVSTKYSLIGIKNISQSRVLFIFKFLAFSFFAQK